MKNHDDKRKFTTKKHAIKSGNSVLKGKGAFKNSKVQKRQEDNESMLDLENAKF